VKALSSKFKAAVEGIQQTKMPFEALNQDIPDDLREVWKESEKLALEYRGQHLSIYDVNLDKGGSNPCYKPQDEAKSLIKHHLLQKCS
jgi:hypothetical protein